MERASEALLALKPVTFRYKKEIDPHGISQFGLIAEEVEKVNPKLVVRDKDGKVNTVRYDAVNAMLLNEFLKEHKKVEQLETTIAQQRKDFEAAMERRQKELEATRTQQQSEIEVLTASLKEQAAQIQKVNAQIEISKRVARVVTNP
jgi:septal ring factor EnvC (AmiA/AmiB activator)